MYKVELATEDLRACRACLATNTQLHSIPDGLEDKFVQLMAVEFSEADGLPQHLCSFCRALLLKFSGFKMRCARAQQLLKQTIIQHPFLSTDNIRAIDRNFNKLALNLVPFSLDNINVDTNAETVKLEDHFHDDFDDREEFDTKRETEANDEIAEPEAHTNESEVDTSEMKPQVLIEIDDINETIKEKSSKAKERCKRRDKRETKKAKSKVKKETQKTKKTAQVRVKKPLMIKNKIHHDNVKEFETKNDCTFKLLSLEEQFREIEERKNSSNYLNLDYKCERCARGFELEQPYKNHMIKHDPSSGKFVCEVCGIHYATQHQKRHHTEYHRIKFTCNICSFVTRTKHHAFRHYQEHNGFRYVCKYCGAKFKKPSTHGTHVRIQHPTEHVPCDICGETFVGASGLRMHKAKVHRQNAGAESESNSCASCGVQFASSYAMKRHTLTSARNKCSPAMRPCMVCGENLASEELLEEHSRSLHAEPQTSCDQCHESFQSEASLGVHRARVHLRVRGARLKAARPRRRAAAGGALVCELCGKKCTNKTILTYHQRTHTGEKPHGCPHCPKTFLSPNLLQSHLRSHTGEKPYKCPQSQCGKAFAYKSALNVHKTVHSGEKPYSCTLCDKTFTQAASVHTHVKYVHMKLPAPPRRRNVAKPQNI